MAVIPSETIELQNIVLPLVRLTNAGPLAMHQTVQFLALHGLSFINDFNLIEPHQVKDLVKALSTNNPTSQIKYVL